MKLTNRTSLSKTELLPLVGALASMGLFALAGARYPGGYDWANDTVSKLFHPVTLDAAVNPARALGVLAVLVFCSSMACVFHCVSKRGKSGFHRSTIQIGGIGSMVYAFLVVTPLHDLLVAVALVFFVTAMLTIFHMLFLERSYRMLLAGMLCISGTLGNATLYYGNVLLDALPSVQKLSLLMWVVWLLALHLGGNKSAVPSPERRSSWAG